MIDKTTHAATTLYVVKTSPEFANQHDRIVAAYLTTQERDAEYRRLEDDAGGTSRMETGWIYKCEDINPTNRIRMLVARGARPAWHNGVWYFSQDGKCDRTTCVVTDYPARDVYAPDSPIKSKMREVDIVWMDAWWEATGQEAPQM